MPEGPFGFPYPTLSAFFEAEGDFPENLQDEEGEVDLPPGYRWATADETEQDGGRMEIPGAMMVTRTFDSFGKRYTQHEADLAVPVATDLDFEPCCYNSTRNFGTGEHEWGCPNY
jgi:hypothetical protein